MAFVPPDDLKNLLRQYYRKNRIQPPKVTIHFRSQKLYNIYFLNIFDTNDCLLNPNPLEWKMFWAELHSSWEGVPHRQDGLRARLRINRWCRYDLLPTEEVGAHHAKMQRNWLGFIQSIGLPLAKKHCLRRIVCISIRNVKFESSSQKQRMKKS